MQSCFVNKIFSLFFFNHFNLKYLLTVYLFTTKVQQKYLNNLQKQDYFLKIVNINSKFIRY